MDHCKVMKANTVTCDNLKLLSVLAVDKRLFGKPIQTEYFKIPRNF